MTPVERQRVKSALLAYVQEQGISVHDLAARINADGKKVDAKVLHRFLERSLQIDDSIMEVYRDFIDRPA